MTKQICSNSGADYSEATILPKRTVDGLPYQAQCKACGQNGIVGTATNEGKVRTHKVRSAK